MSNSALDYYKVLGLQSLATDGEIKTAYHNLAKQYHPDRCKQKGEKDKFKHIAEAYAVLSDEKQRAAYDRKRVIKQHTLSQSDINSVFSKIFQKNNYFNKPSNGNDNSGTTIKQVASNSTGSINTYSNGPAQFLSTSLGSFSGINVGSKRKQGSSSQYVFTGSNSNNNFANINLATKQFSFTDQSASNSSFSHMQFQNKRKMTAKNHSFTYSASEPLYSPQVMQQNNQNQRYNIIATIPITFNESMFGCSKTLVISRKLLCPDCKKQDSSKIAEKKTCAVCSGTGNISLRTDLSKFSHSPHARPSKSEVQQTAFPPLSIPCVACKSVGYQLSYSCTACRGCEFITKDLSLEVALPAGVDENWQVVFKGKGDEAKNNEIGDLVVGVEIEAHPFFKREGSNISCDLPISFSQAALGTTLEIPSPHGKTKVPIPPGTQPNEIIVIKGQGFHLNKYQNCKENSAAEQKGDLLVRVLVTIPKSLTSEQKSLLERFQSISEAGDALCLGFNAM